MTWYEAEKWCQENGMTMPTMYEICPSWDGEWGDKKCPFISSGVGFVWTATIYEKNDAWAWIIYLDNGTVFEDGDRADWETYPICR